MHGHLVHGTRRFLAIAGNERDSGTFVKQPQTGGYMFAQMCAQFFGNDVGVYVDH